MNAMNEEKKPESLANIGLDSALLGNSDIKVGEGNYSEAIRLAVVHSKPKKKVNGLPHGVHTTEKIEEMKEQASKRKAKEVLGDKRLTSRMRAFGTYVAQGDSPRDAVQKAYNCSKSTQSSIMVLANRLMRDVRINVFIESLTDITKEAILKEELKTRQKVLDELYDHAMCKDNALSLRIRSLELIGKSVGMFNDKVEANREVQDIDQLKKELEQSMSLLDETAKVRNTMSH